MLPTGRGAQDFAACQIRSATRPPPSTPSWRRCARPSRDSSVSSPSRPPTRTARSPTRRSGRSGSTSCGSISNDVFARPFVAPVVVTSVKGVAACAAKPRGCGAAARHDAARQRADPRQGRAAAPGRAAGGTGSRGCRRDRRDRLGLARRLASRSRGRRASASSRSRRRTSATGARATSRPSSRPATCSPSSPRTRRRSPAGSRRTSRRSSSTTGSACRSGRTCRGPDTSPMVARELTEFFAGFSPGGGPVVRGRDEKPYLSNVNAVYRRACWSELRFRDVAYAEDQAFARDLLERDWLIAYHPAAAVLHAHDYATTAFMRRYFDEYRGLRETTGHVEAFDPVPRRARDGRRRSRRRAVAAPTGRGRRRRGALDPALGGASRRAQGLLGARIARLVAAAARPARAVTRRPRRRRRPAARRSRRRRSASRRAASTSTTCSRSSTWPARGRRRCSSPCPACRSASGCGSRS